jgi:hypothetical protein
MRFVSQQILRPGSEGVHPIDRRIALKVHLDAGETAGRSEGHVEVTRGGEMGIFGKVYVTKNGTCTSPLGVFGSSLSSKSLKTNGAEPADAPA